MDSKALSSKAKGKEKEEKQWEVRLLVYILVELWKGCMWVPALFTGLSRIPENAVYNDEIGCITKKYCRKKND